MRDAPAGGELVPTAVAVVAICFLANVLARGVSETYAVFLLPLGQEFDWSRSALTGVYSTYMLVHGLAAPLAGIAFDRVGPRALYAFGLVSLGAGYWAAGRLHALWQFHLCVGVLGGLGVAALGMVPASALVSRWFRARLATAMGVTYAGLGAGVIALVPFTAWLIEQVGWRAAYGAIGIALLALLPAVLLAPWSRLLAGPHAPAPPRPGGPAADAWTLRRALRDSGFWGLFLVFFFTAFAIYAVALQAVVYLVELGFSPLDAATAFGLVSLLSVAGMVGAGWLADRVGRRVAVAVTFGFTLTGIASLAALALAPGLLVLALFVLTFGPAQGSRGPIIATLTAELFPGPRVGAIYGTASMGMGLGAAAGSWASGALHDLTGAYWAGFGVAAAGALMALGQFWWIPKLARPRPVR